MAPEAAESRNIRSTPRYAHALLTLGLLVDAVYSFVMRLGARDIDTTEWDSLDPAVTKACFGRVNTPAGPELADTG